MRSLQERYGLDLTEDGMMVCYPVETIELYLSEEGVEQPMSLASIGLCTDRRRPAHRRCRCVGAWPALRAAVPAPCYCLRCGAGSGYALEVQPLGCVG